MRLSANRKMHNADMHPIAELFSFIIFSHFYFHIDNFSRRDLFSSFFCHYSAIL